jgi:hypothetical protein
MIALADLRFEMMERVNDLVAVCSRSLWSQIDVHRSNVFFSDRPESSHCFRKYSCALSAKAPEEK